MASLTIEEQLEVEAPAETVWRYLIDPERIVVCLPGAALELIQDERTFLGKVRVKVGAVTVSYRGTIKFTEVDNEARLVRMVGKGREKGGAGSATMTMESRVTEIPTGARVVVHADVKLSGKIVRFGRGMIEGVAREIFAEFGVRLVERLAAESEPVPMTGAMDTPAGTVELAGTTSDAGPPLQALPLFWRALRSWLRRILGR